MTWDRKEALRLADDQRGSRSASMLHAAVAEIDRRDRIEAGRERLTDTIDRLTAELDQLRSEGAARMDATEELLRARIAELTSERDKLRSDYAGWSEYSTELANERDHWRRARDTAMESGEVLRRQRDAVRTDFDNALEAWGKEVDAVTKERDAALARVKELEAERASAAGEVLVNVADMPPGSTLGKVVIANRLLKHENKNLRERIADLEVEVNDLQANNRTAELAWKLAEDRNMVLAGLRAIYPVYRAAVAMSPDWNDTSGSFSRIDAMNDHCAAIDRLASAARDALASGLIATLKAAGVEVE